MHETLALSRYVLAQHRYLIGFLLAAVVIGQVSAIAMWTFVPTLGDGGPQLIALFLGMMPAGVAVLGLFDYGHDRDLMTGESGCSHWMLRMPIASWKLALVPIVLKTIWISTLWILLVTTAQRLNIARGAPIGDACILFSAGATWLLAIGWRPFRNGWYRLGALVVVAIVVLFALVAVFSSNSINGIAWQPWAVTGSYLLAISLYALGVWFTIRCTELAKTSSWGLIPERGSARIHSMADEYGVRDHVTARRALVWHDLERTKGFVRYTFIFGVIPLVLIATFIVQLHAATVGMALLLFAYCGAIATVAIDSQGKNSTRELPPYLAGSPLSTATIAWTRLLVSVAVALAMSLCVMFAFMGWAVWSENRSIWVEWASQRAESLDASASAITIGIRYSVAIVIGSLVLFQGRMISFMWINMAGRTWLNVLFSAALSLLCLTPALVFLCWFHQQDDWETATEAMYGWLVWVPYLVAGLLAVKAVCVSAATTALWRSRITTPSNVVKAIAWWCLVTIGIALAMFALIPDPRATFLWCLIGTTLAIPLARVLMLPISLAYNRHR